jgi:hypothetical protein
MMQGYGCNITMFSITANHQFKRICQKLVTGPSLLHIQSHPIKLKTMQMNRKTEIGILFITNLVALIGCSKSDNDENAVLQVMLTDAPAEYDAVYIDVQDVQIQISSAEGDEESWIGMEVNKGLYNLLNFRNGLDTLLATIELPAGHVSQMRLILGPDNFQWITICLI